MKRYFYEAEDDYFILSFPLFFLLTMVIVINVSLWMKPAKKYDPNWNSYSSTGWRMGPGKLGTTRYVEMMVEPEMVKKTINESKKGETNAKR